MPLTRRGANCVNSKRGCPRSRQAAGPMRATLAARRRAASTHAERRILNRPAGAVGEQSGYRLLRSGGSPIRAGRLVMGRRRAFRAQRQRRSLRRAVRLFATQNAPSGGDVSLRRKVPGDRRVPCVISTHQNGVDPGAELAARHRAYPGRTKRGWRGRGGPRFAW
jgi:hypothetical protein